MSSSNSSNKRVAKGPKAKKEYKKTCVRTSIEPDVTIIMGGVEFLEYSHILCLWSDYFNAAFRSGMKESTTKRFEFPDKNPSDWEALMEAMNPKGPGLESYLTKHNIFDVFLPWLDELICCKEYWEICDRFVTNVIPKWEDDEDMLFLYFEKMLDARDKIVKYNLPLSHEACCKSFRNTLGIGIHVDASLLVGIQVRRLLGFPALNDD